MNAKNSTRLRLSARISFSLLVLAARSFFASVRSAPEAEGDERHCIDSELEQDLLGACESTWGVEEHDLALLDNRININQLAYFGLAFV